MKLRTRYIIISVCLAVVVIASLVGGLFGIAIDMNKQSKITLSADTLTQLHAIMDDTAATPDELAAIDSRLSVLKYRLIWLAADHSLLYGAEAGLSSGTLDKLQTQYLDNEQTTVVIDTNAVYVVHPRPTGDWLIAVRESPQMEVAHQNLFLYGLLMTVLVLLSCIIHLVAETALVFPKLNKLDDAMRQIYIGNYDKTLDFNPRSKDEITKLMVDLDMLRRKLDQALQEKNEFERERGIMISGISHDLRTPLTVIKSNAKGLMDGVPQRLGKTDKYIETIYNTATSMEDMINRLNSFSQGQTNEGVYSFADKDLGELLKDFVDKHYFPYAARGLVIKLRLPKNRRVIVSADKEQLYRVWRNIADNSLKYKSGEVGHLTISMEVKEDSAVVLLADDGPGVADYEAEYIFESYYRGDPSRTDPIQGSGLGLSIVKRIIIAHHGQVTAYNNHGLTIQVILPVRRKK